MNVHTSEAQVTAISGGTFSDQVAELVRRAEELVARGENPARIALFAASPAAAAYFEKMLARTSAAGIAVTTPFEEALRLIDEPACRAFIGRSGRVLEPQDINTLLEDVKSCGLRTGKLRAMLRFFDRTLASLEDEGLWFKSQDDMDTYGILSDLLNLSGGVLPSEVANRAWRFLNANPAQRAKAQYAHVIVSDFQNLSRASQALSCILARETLAVWGNADVSRTVYDRFPYSDGMAELLACNPNARQLTLEEHRGGRLAAASATLRAEASGPGRSPFMDDVFPAVEKPREGVDLRVVPCEDETDEILFAAKFVADARAEGIAADDIMVIAPNALWRKNIEKALASAGVQTTRMTGAGILSCDIRDFGAALPARIHTMLQLAANEHDAVAWRAWCGYGDWLANSADVVGLLECARAERDAGKPLPGFVELLERASDPEGGAALHARMVADAYRLGRQVLAELEGKTGRELLEAIAFAMTGEQGSLPPALVRLYAPEPNAPIPADATAKQLIAWSQRALFAASFQGAGVRVCLPSQAYGENPRTCLWTGFANGFVPGRDYFDNVASSDVQQQREWVTDSRLILSVLSATRDSFTASYPEHISATVAERVGAIASRIKLVNRKKMFLQTPSEFVRVLQA